MLIDIDSVIVIIFYGLLFANINSGSLLQRTKNLEKYSGRIYGGCYIYRFTVVCRHN